jgi:prepilin peptidase CpaA
MFSLLPQKVEMALLALLLVAAIYDVRYRRIPNWLTVTGVVAALVMNSVIGPPLAGLVFTLEGFAVAFGVYLLLYLLRAMGAGDVKLMAAVGAIAGWQRWLGIFFVTAIVGGVMAMLLVTARKRIKSTFWNLGFILTEMKSGRPAYLLNEELDVRSPKAMGLPHGAVIAVGFVFYLAIALRLSR